jgi:NTE family protein
MTGALTVHDDAPELGLVLTGGGARAAYQAGVLKGIAELLPRGAACPFPVITGTSAGAVSAIALASDPAHFREAVHAIERVWRAFRVHHVFKADALSVFRSGLHWMLALTTGGWLVRSPKSLFDNTPLWDLLRVKLNFDGIPRGLYKRHLSAIGVCATGYADAHSVTFYACASSIDPWQRAFRKGARVQLTLEHLMASLAIALEPGDSSGRESAARHRCRRHRNRRSRPAQSEGRTHLRADVRLHAGFAVHGPAAF